MKIARVAALAVLALAPALATAPAHAQQSVQLAWTATASAASNPAVTYNVYRAASCAGTFARINAAPVAATSYLDAPVLPATIAIR